MHIILTKSTPVTGNYRQLYRLFITSLFFLIMQVPAFSAFCSFPFLHATGYLPVVPAKPVPTPSKNQDTQDKWVYDKTVGNVEFYHRLTECSGQKVVFLKLNNKNSNTVHVSWKEVFATQMQAETEGFTGKKQLTLKPGESYVKDCSDNKLKELLVLPTQVNPTYVVEIKQFEFKDIAVNKAM